MTGRARAWVAVAAVLALCAVAGGYLWHAAGRSQATRPPTAEVAQAAGRPVQLDQPGQLLFRTAGHGPDGGRLAAVDLADLAGRPVVTGLSCVRLYASGGTGVCLTVERAVISKISAVVLDKSLRPLRTISLAGAPSRARVSPSGRMVAWTVFVSGDSYLSAGLSTRTGVLDTRTGRVVPSLEDFKLIQDGKPNHSPDLNFWGVTFTRDDDRFYATVRTKGKTYLVEGQMATRTLRTVRRDVECPSLSPGGNLIVFKKATGNAASPWRLHTLDLTTMRETPLAESASVDDQATWLDERTVIYGRLRGESTDLWKVPADGTGTPKLLLSDAYSPAVIR